LPKIKVDGRATLIAIAGVFTLQQVKSLNVITLAGKIASVSEVVTGSNQINLVAQCNWTGRYTITHARLC